MTAKQADYLSIKCKNEGIIGIEQVYECEWNNEEKADSKLNPYVCAMLDDFKLSNVHVENAETERYKSRLCLVQYRTLPTEYSLTQM